MYSHTTTERPPGLRQFLHCELFGIPIVMRLPETCPFNAANQLDEIERWQDAAWRLSRESPESEPVHALFASLDTCRECVAENSSNERIRSLRCRTLSSNS